MGRSPLLLWWNFRLLQHALQDGRDRLKHRSRMFGLTSTGPFGGIRTCLAGFDWVEAADALKPLGDFWVQLFHLYVPWIVVRPDGATTTF